MAKAAAGGATAAVDVAFLDPTPWLRRAFKYTRALNKGSDEVDDDVFVLPSQSIILKYAMGDGPQIRRPGDVGLVKDAILVPNWKNLQLAQGINRNTYGNLPGGVAARLAREAVGQRAERRVPGRWGVYKGELDVGGSRVTGYSARPPRGYAPIGKGSRSNVVNLGCPRALLIAMQQPHTSRSCRSPTTRPCARQSSGSPR